jgi:hypothetical protein
MQVSGQDTAEEHAGAGKGIGRTEKTLRDFSSDSADLNPVLATCVHTSAKSGAASSNRCDMQHWSVSQHTRAPHRR